MDPAIVGVIGFVVLLLLIAVGVPVAIAMAIPGLLGLFYLVGFPQTLELFAMHSFRYATSFSFTCVPLFLLMGYIAMQSGLISKAYDSARLWLHRVPGGLAMATSVASGIFGACMGSGVAATATMSRIAIPEMLRHGYDKGLSAGSVAASSTVAVLIPPSVVMVIYAVFAEVSLGKMLLAGYLPGLLSIIVYMVMIGVRVRLNPHLAPSVKGEVVSWKQRLVAIKDLWGVFVLFAVLMGGIYTGFFTATEAAAVGAFAAFMLMFITRSFNWVAVKRAFAETIEITAMAFLMLVAAVIFVIFMDTCGLPQMLTTLIVNAHLPTYLFLMMLVVLYIFLGCFLPSIAMLLVTLPVILPVLIDLDINLIWFGIIFIKMTEVGGITPPFGMSVYVVKAAVRDSIPLGDIFRGIGWFIVMDLVTVGILMAVPAISLWLPNTIRGG